ncbi:5'-nucleotidase [Sanguibacter suarezii]|uniref:5'-nucleotidase n=1 Tax=Sanguibacter suarezii TaxID=60921 RepID=UPI000A06436C|nr:5'-nucleotidase [Sanguibacter suarezii]
MGYDLSERLVIGVASSALFDLTESHAVFEQGIEEYRAFQDTHVGDPLPPGVAFPFIKRLLGLNDLRSGSKLVEVFILSKNDPTTGLRLMRSIEHYDLAIERAAFTRGRAPFEYIPALDISLFLSGNENDVKEAMALGHPAGLVLGSAAVDHGDADDDDSLRVAFDFDGVIADDGSERIYKSGDLTSFLEHEVANRFTPLRRGPLRDFLTALSRVQEIERVRADSDGGYSPRVRVSVVTARQAPAHERAIKTLRSWNVEIDDAFFLGGVDKGRVLRVLKPHIMFDDQLGHLDPVAKEVASVLIPYGVSNESPPTPGEGTPVLNVGVAVDRPSLPTSATEAALG